MRAVWFEAALNGPWGRQLDSPITVGEIIACARAGASIIHRHAYGAATGGRRAVLRDVAPPVPRPIWRRLPLPPRYSPCPPTAIRKKTA